MRIQLGKFEYDFIECSKYSEMLNREKQLL